jgi:signal transduction histidine kinase
MNERVTQLRDDSLRTKRTTDIAVLFFVLLFGLSSSMFGFHTLQTSQHLQTHEAMRNVAQTVVQAFEVKLAAAVSAVQYGGLMIEVDSDISNSEFQSYAARALEKHESVRIFEWQPIVLAGDLQQFEADARSQGMPEFRVVQPDANGNNWEVVSGRPFYVPVLYAWPASAGTVGFDLSFSPVRMESKLKSAQLGTPVSSGVFDLMQSGKVSSGEMAFAISQAVFDGKEKAIESRLQSTLKGYVAAVIPISPLFAQAKKMANAAKFDLFVMDASANDDALIYSSNSLRPAMAGSEKMVETDEDIIQVLNVASRSWKLVLRPQPAFFTNTSRYFATSILLVGIALTLLLVFTIAKIQRGRKSLEMASVLLEQRVEERTEELSTALESLTTAHTELLRLEKASILGTMVSGIGHELNTPIGNCLTVASTLKDHVHTVALQLEQGMSRRQMNEFVDQANTGTDILVRGLQKAAELISSFKQVAIDQESEARRSFFLHTAVTEVLLLLTPSMRQSSVKVICEIADDLQMDSYPGAIYQIITNLVNNCLLHGYGEQQEGNIIIRAQRLDDQRLKLEVSDDGIGIPEADLKRVFDPFFTTKRGQGGSGLGLNVVFNLVKKTLGGDLTLSSISHHGTTVTMIIPINTPDH